MCLTPYHCAYPLSFKQVKSALLTDTIAALGLRPAERAAWRDAQSRALTERLYAPAAAPARRPLSALPRSQRLVAAAQVADLTVQYSHDLQLCSLQHPGRATGAWILGLRSLCGCGKRQQMQYDSLGLERWKSSVVSQSQVVVLQTLLLVDHFGHVFVHSCITCAGPG